MQVEKNPEISSSARLSEVLDQLTVDQMRFVAARQEFSSKKEAAISLGIEPDTVYHWPKIVDEAIRLTALKIHEAAVEIRKRNLLKAMLIKVSGLDCEDVSLQQKVATEIIEAELGKPIQRQEVSNTDSNPSHVVVLWSDKYGDADNE
jgi:hypothetical protein